MISAQAAFLTSRRSDFVGRTDKYSDPVNLPARIGSIQDAMGGYGPFDVTRTLFDERERELSINRLNRYRTNWRYYKGEHHTNPYYDGEKKPVFNFCDTVVNKAIEYFCAKGWSTSMPKGNELVGQAIDLVWEANNKALLTSMLAQYASVTGDAFMYVTVQTQQDGVALPKDQWRVALLPLNPSYCFPEFDAKGNISRILIQYPKSNDPQSSALYSLFITDKIFQSFQDDRPLTAPIANPFGKVNVVHFRNLPLANSNFGTSDIDQVIPLNDSYNKIAFAIERIIRYHAEPTTIIKGARASSLEKGANKVWSGIPVDGEVSNLEMKGDLSAVENYLERIWTRICEQSSTPKVAMDGSDLPHSNTAGVAMELMFKPLLDKTKRRWDGFSDSFRKVSDLIIIAHREILKQPLEPLADFPKTMSLSKVQPTSNMPRDEKLELETAKLKREMGLISEAQLLRQFAPNDSDPERLALELAADRMYDLASASELARAEMGIPPALGVVFLSSIYLNEDLEDTAKQVSALDKKYPTELLASN